MSKKIHRKFWTGAAVIAAFFVWTVLVCMVDVQPIGLQGSSVGFASINGFVHQLTGVHMTLYTLTDWLSIVPLGVIICFALMGLRQWICRKSVFLVDRSILALGAFYLVVMAFYALFETLVVNVRPVLIQGVMEASYPSSTTVLVLCVMPTAGMQLRGRIKSKTLSRSITAAVNTFTALMVTARLLSGVHWLTDIIGGVLLSAGLVMLYNAVCSWNEAA